MHLFARGLPVVNFSRQAKRCGFQASMSDWHAILIAREKTLLDAKEEEAFKSQILCAPDRSNNVDVEAKAFPAIPFPLCS